MLWDLFINVFESRVASWMTSGCYPFQELPLLLAPRPPLSTLVVRLDKERKLVCSRGGETSPTATVDYDPSHEDDDPISQAFISAIHAYSMRWLRDPGNDKPEFKSGVDIQTQNRISTTVWYQARQRIQSAMSIPSYRSVLALHIFGLTPVPPDQQEGQIRDLCIEIALNHQNRLREEKGRDSQSYLATASVPWSGPEKQQNQLDGLESPNLQNMLYWFGMTCDTSRSLTRSCPSILVPRGIDDCNVWNHVEDNVNCFEETFGMLRYFDEPLSDDSAAIILQHASASYKMFWGAVVQVQDAVKLCQIPMLNLAISTALKLMGRFNEVFKLLLDRCGRDIMLLNERCQLDYVLVIIHFHLAVLVLLDTIPESAKTDSMVFEHKNLRKGSCVATVNAFSAALQVDKATLQGRSISTILMLDPCPDILAFAIRQAASSLMKLHEISEISTRTLNTMSSVLLNALKQLSDTIEGGEDQIEVLEMSLVKIKDSASKIGARAPRTTHGYLVIGEQTIEQLEPQIRSYPNQILSSLKIREEQCLSVTSTQCSTGSTDYESVTGWNLEARLLLHLQISILVLLELTKYRNSYTCLRNFNAHRVLACILVDLLIYV
ncbi:hypothetical protein BP6252_11380 [Coleophoma cylindrospora]|uniref:Transcription factor domain-containing protein n=1 Tax=Coleophoma cylindrospora TaxID=1849047 RepID=A0A3D8QJM4_9HELO|nr:hypothetical protein BP6252_11380 [Coleophoma cylindrospora]